MIARRVMGVPEERSQRDWIAAICSVIAHLLVLISLAVWSVGIGWVGDSITILSGQGDSEELGDLELAPNPSESEQLEEDSNPSLPNEGLIPGMILAELKAEASDLPANQSIIEIPSDLKLPPGGGTSGFVESSLDGRTKENRKRLALEQGGSPQSEEAVERALDYLARHQFNDGSWSLGFSKVCDDQCEERAANRMDSARTAATGLALLCFLGAGKTEQDEQYGTNVSKAIYFLEQTFKRDSATGYWVGTESTAQMYEHGIATLALCEALQMQPSEQLRETCQLAINFIVEAQFRDGGWDYHPGSPGDLSVAAWQVMALKSAFSAKLRVPQRTISAVDRFLEKSRGGEFMYRYRDRKPTASMTAIGNLIQIFRGRSREARSISMAVEYLGERGPSNDDLYYNYYATQLMFQYGGPPWKAWNYKMRDYLVRTQEIQGHAAGSWWFEGDYSNDVGGRLYTTCMSCLILEVYYRYLPVYTKPTEDFQF